MKEIPQKKMKAYRGIRITGIVISIILFVWFFLPYVAANILNIGNMTGMLIAVVLFLYMCFMPTVHQLLQKWWQKKIMKQMLITSAAFLTVIVLVAVVESGCMVWACVKEPAENATAVVLGCRVYGERASLSLVERLEAAYEYLEENPEAVCVVSGGQGRGENISEAECMKRWLIKKGISEERIYKEETSTSTEENIAFSKEVIQEKNLNKEIAIITSEYHTYRAVILAEKNGLECGSAPGQTALWLFPTYYVRELYAILAEWVL